VPQECLDVESALRAYTWGGAVANFCDDDRGILSPGRLGDLAVLTRDVLACEDPAEILDTQVDLTVVGGTVVWERRGH
jgi:hypothetical protein